MAQKLQKNRDEKSEVLMKQGIQKDDLKWENWIKDNITLFHSIINETFGFVSLKYILTTENVNDYKKLVNSITKVAPEKKNSL